MKRLNPVYCILALAVACFAVLPVLAEAKPVAADRAMPSAEKVLDRYIEVTGGAKAYKKVENRRTVGKMSLPAMGIEGPIEVWQAAPNLSYTEAQIAGMGTIKSGSNGAVSWEISAMAGPRIIEGAEKAMRERSEAIDATLNWRKYYEKAEVTGRETVAEEEAYKVVMTPKQGKPVTHFYSVASGLLLKTDMVIETQMGEITSESFAEDYAEFGGILAPRRTRMKAMSMEQILTLEKIEHNIEMPADRFALPTEIQALAAKE